MFEFLVTPYIINIAYILGFIFPFYLIYIFYDKIQFVFKNKKLLLGFILVIILYEIMLRIFFEFMIVYFHMFNELKEIKLLIKK